MKQQGATFKNWINSVGKLFQAETQYFAQKQTFIYQEAARPSQKPLIARLRKLDRRPHLEQVATAITIARAEPRTKPLVVLLDGRPEDEVLSFVKRLKDHDFEQNMLLPCDYLGSFDWPNLSLHLTINQLLSALYKARKMEVPTRSLAADALGEMMASHDRSIAFAHVLDPDACRSEMLKEWEGLIMESCRNPASGLLICFLCVQHRNPERERSAWVSDALSALAARHGWCVVDPLTPIEPQHLTDWIEGYNNEEETLPELDRISPAIAESVFDQEPSLYYRDTVERVLKLLEPQMKPEKTWRPV